MSHDLTYKVELLISILIIISRPDSIICKICDPTVSEKPGGSSARRRSARSARASARSYAPGDEEAAVGDPEPDLAPDDAASNTEDLASLQTETEEVPDADPEAGEDVEAADNDEVNNEGGGDEEDTPPQEDPENNDETNEEPAEADIEDDME